MRELKQNSAIIYYLSSELFPVWNDELPVYGLVDNGGASAEVEKLGLADAVLADLESSEVTRCRI